MIHKIQTHAKRIYLALIIILLYAPIGTLIVLSFNDSKTRAKWGGFTFDWYVSLFQDAEIMNALYTTLVIALLSAFFATVIGTMAALAIQAMGKKIRTVLLGVANIPMLNADIVTGISLMLLFIAIRMNMGFSTILMAHITFNIPYVILSVLPRLKQTNRSTYEAALDLGASPIQAFFQVVLPDILPGIFTGFLLSFTMSLDDFVITHFTKGPGINTLSTQIYSEVRKGIQPEMYALSTLLFISVLILLILVNASPSRKKKVIDSEASLKKLRINKMIYRRIVPFVLSILVVFGGIYYGFSENSPSGKQVIVYNWGEYIDPTVLEIFEEETGIDVIYEEFETNEIMYPKISSGALPYDVVCPSDYMIERMIEENLLQELNYDNIPNITNIDPTYLAQAEQFDPENKYSVPYCWGTVGILYNTTMVEEPIDSWSVLWDEQYANNILMQDSVRDAFMVALKYNGHSLNSTDLDELYAAQELLMEQKPLTQAYVVDQVRDKMIGNEAAIGIIYSGEAIYTQSENPDLEYVIPKEGSNVWIDGWAIPKNAENKENAEAFINFLCRPDIALLNFEYITYSTPNAAARALIEDDEVRNSNIAFPTAEQLANCETFRYLGPEMTNTYNKLWQEIKSN